MKVLIGTPIHACKDYCMEQWLENVARLRRAYPVDFLMADNSPDLAYVEKVKGYCAKCGVNNYKIIHLDLPQGMTIDDKCQRIEISQEAIRDEILSRGYDALFSWECDQILPVDALDKLIKIMEAGNFTIVTHNCWTRKHLESFNLDMGCALIARAAMEKQGFKTPPPPPGFSEWEGDDDLFKKRVLNSGGSYVQVYGVIAPIYHLDDATNESFDRNADSHF